MDEILRELKGLNESIGKEGGIKVTPLTSLFLANQKNVEMEYGRPSISFSVDGGRKTIPLIDRQFSYLKNMGFPGRNWGSFSADHSRNRKVGIKRLANALRGRKTYLPLIRTDREEDNDSRMTDDSFINYMMNDVAGIKNFHFKSLIMTVFGEIIDNIRDHSEYSKRFLFCQKWKDNSLQVAILDDGVGFKGSLKEKNESRALDLAVCKRVSCRKNYDDRGIGLGLQHLKASVLNDEVKGEFCAVSNKDYIHFGDGGLKKGKLDFSCNGVLIALRFNNLDTANFEEAYRTTLRPEEFLIDRGYLDKKKS